LGIKVAPRETENNAYAKFWWSASTQIDWNKRKFLHKKKVQLPQGRFGTPTACELCATNR